MYLMWTINLKHLIFFWFLAKQALTHEMVLRGLSSHGQVKNLHLSSELATAQEKHKGMPTFTVWGAPPKLNKQPLFGNHQ